LAETAREDRAIRYLLGKMSELEENQFEAQYFADDDLFEEMVGLENELIDSYVRGELSDSERQQFEHGYLTAPASRENLRFAKAFAGCPSKVNGKIAVSGLRSVTERNSPPVPATRAWPVRVTFAAMLLVAIVSVSWMVVANRRLHHEIDQMRAQQARLPREESGLPQQSAELSAQPRDKTLDGEQEQRIANVRPPGPDIIALALSPGLDRSTDGPKKLVISPATLLVQLQLYLERDDYPSYSASLETAEGAQVWKKNGLKRHPGRGATVPVILGIPASVLQGNDYLVRLTGVAANGKVEEVEDYRFLVVRHVTK